MAMGVYDCIFGSFDEIAVAYGVYASPFSNSELDGIARHWLSDPGGILCGAQQKFTFVRIPTKHT